MNKQEMVRIMAEEFAMIDGEGNIIDVDTIHTYVSFAQLVTKFNVIADRLTQGEDNAN